MNPFFAKKSNAQVGSSAFQEEKDTIDATTANSGTVHASVAASGGGFSGAASFQVNYLTFVKILSRKLKLDSMGNCISLMYISNLSHHVSYSISDSLFMSRNVSMIFMFLFPSVAPCFF